MLNEKILPRAAGGILGALMLAGCAGAPFGGGSQAPETAMAGRWILAAPGAPTCGMNFAGGTRNGNVSPEGGCPGKFYQSRRWLFEDSVLVINDDESATLARLNAAGGRFEGQSSTGLAVTLTRQAVLAAPEN